MEAKTGERPKELDECEPPIGALHIWQWFWELNGTRTSNGFGANPIQYSEIVAWARLHGIRPKGLEIELIRALDGLYLGVAREE